MWSYWRCDFSESRDLKSVIQNIQRNNPKAPMAAIGYSAGGHLLMRYVSSYGDAVPLSCAITVSGCFDFVKAFECVSNNENPSYKIFLDVQERRVIRRHVENAGHTQDINEKIEEAMRTEGGIELYVQHTHTAYRCSTLLFDANDYDITTTHQIRQSDEDHSTGHETEQSRSIQPQGTYEECKDFVTDLTLLGRSGREQ